MIRGFWGKKLILLRDVHYLDKLPEQRSTAVEPTGVKDCLIAINYNGLKQLIRAATKIGSPLPRYGSALCCSGGEEGECRAIDLVRAAMGG